MEKRTRVCSCCGQENYLDEYYSNGIHVTSSVCKQCVLFQKIAVRYKDKMDPVDYEKWFNENNPRIAKPKEPKKRGIKNTYMYRNLLRFGNCYVRELDMKVILELEFALNKKIKYNETKDNIGYVLEVIKC